MIKKLSIIITIIGIGIIVYGYMEYDKYAEEVNSYELVNAKVDAIEINAGVKTITFKYDVDNTSYTSKITTDENLEEGNTKDIYYNKYRPTNTKLSLLTIYKSILILIVGLVVFIFGMYLNVTKWVLSSRKKRLLKKGIKVMANIQEVLVVQKDKGKNPYKIRATYTNTATNDTYFYESEEDFTDLKDIVSRKNITTIPVYVNPKNGNDYYVDIESIKV